MKRTPEPWTALGAKVYGNGTRALLPFYDGDAVLMAAAPRMAKALQRAAHLLAELSKSEQTPQMLALRAEIVETIKQATPDYYEGGLQPGE